MPRGYYPRLDITGKVFNHLTVVEQLSKRRNGSVLWLCRCDCGEHCERSRTDLKTRHRKHHCGCQIEYREPGVKGGNQPLDLTGQQFGKLTALSVATRSTGRGVVWLCACKCGNTTRALLSSLTSGNTTSCGCKHQEALVARNFRHGKCGTDEFHAWNAMKRRCVTKNPRVRKYYGDRGIKVCDRWLADFKHFLADVGLKPTKTHSLDRIDPNGNYEPGNVRWATPETQARNRRGRQSLTFAGQTMFIDQWAEIVNLSPRLIAERKKNGWTPEQILTTPRGRRRGNYPHNIQQVTAQCNP